MWCPLALLSLIRPPLRLHFLIRSWIQKWMWRTSEVSVEGRGRPELFLISSRMEQSLYPPPQLRGELVFNIPGHVFWQGTQPQTTPRTVETFERHSDVFDEEIKAKCGPRDRSHRYGWCGGRPLLFNKGHSVCCPFEAFASRTFPSADLFCGGLVDSKIILFQVCGKNKQQITNKKINSPKTQPKPANAVLLPGNICAPSFSLGVISITDIRHQGHSQSTPGSISLKHQAAPLCRAFESNLVSWVSS